MGCAGPEGAGKNSVVVTSSADGPSLLAPTVKVRVSFLAAMAQFQAEGRGEPGDNSVLGQQIRRHSATWTTLRGFADYVARVRAEALPDTPRPPGIVASTDLWWIRGDAYLGRVSVRHALTDRLQDSGGHIGYDVVPSERRQGHATAMLIAALRVAAGLGIDSALLTCVPGNVASRRVIERCGGVLDSGDERVLRFWIPTCAARGPVGPGCHDQRHDHLHGCGGR
jgi:predicted acetyltransferase